MVGSVGFSAVIPGRELHNTGLDLGGWVISLSIAFGLGVIFLVFGVILRKKSGRGGVMRRREAMALVGVGWFVCSFVAAMPYYFCEPGVPLSAAYFEGVSGLTTTGATIFVDLESLPRSILMWRSFSEWFGAMGILAMFVLVLSGMTSTSKTLIGAESSLSNSDIASLRQTMRRLWGVYAVFTVVCGLGLWAMGLSPFQASNHALTAVATGGFGTENASIGGSPFGVLSKIWLMLFMLLGAVSFPLFLSLFAKKKVDLRGRYEEVLWFGVIVLIAVLVLVVQHFVGGMGHVALIDIVFNVVSVTTSTGFVSGDLSSWSRLGVGMVLVLMIVGGCSGSTAGGLKVNRLMMWWRFMKVGVVRTFRPKVVSSIKVNGRTVQDGAIEQLFMILTLFGFFAIMGTFLLQVLEPGQSLLGSMSAVVSCLSNFGPALAEMGEADGFAGVGATTKLLLVLLMILGRLEYLALLVLFTGQLWKRY